MGLGKVVKYTNMQTVWVLELPSVVYCVEGAAGERWRVKSKASWNGNVGFHVQTLT